MSGVNKVIIVGRVGKDPDIRSTASGNMVANLSVATSENWKDKATGEKKEKTEWHRISAFGRLAEIIGEYVKKGSLVYVEGSLQTRSWEKDGVTRYTTEIKAKELQMLGGKPQTQQTQQQLATQQEQQKAGDGYDATQDIPF